METYSFSPPAGKVLMNRCPQLSEFDLSAREKLFKGKNIKNLKRVKLKVTFITENSHHAVLSR